MSKEINVADVRDVAPGECKVVEVEGQSIALFNVDGMFYAIANECTHKGGLLGEGDLEEKTVTCPWHGAKFDVTTGRVLAPPAHSDVRRYNVAVRGQEILVQVD